jgi:hypothetical protein
LPVDILHHTGLRTDIGTLHGELMWALCGLVVLAAIAGKIGAAPRRRNGLLGKEALVRGCVDDYPELIAVNLGHDLGL